MWKQRVDEEAEGLNRDVEDGEHGGVVRWEKSRRMMPSGVV